MRSLKGSNAITPPQGILETALYARDLEAARAFYAGILMLDEVLAREGEFVFFRCGGSMVLIFNPEITVKQPLPPPARAVPGHGNNGTGHLCFQAPGERLEQWKNHLIANGVAVESEITWDNGARSIYFRDPAGNSLEFAQPRLWGYDETEQSA